MSTCTGINVNVSPGPQAAVLRLRYRKWVDLPLTPRFHKDEFNIEMKRVGRSNNELSRWSKTCRSEIITSVTKGTIFIFTLNIKDCNSHSEVKLRDRRSLHILPIRGAPCCDATVRKTWNNPANSNQSEELSDSQLRLKWRWEFVSNASFLLPSLTTILVFSAVRE